MNVDNTKYVVAHLGAHKTATSLVQKYFLNKQKYYATKGLNFISRSEISPFISWGDKVSEEPKALRQVIQTALEVENTDRVFFSNENALGRPFTKALGLYPSHDSIIPAFAKALDGIDTRIVYTIRPQHEFLESYYLQRIHQGDSISFAKFIETIDLSQLHWSPIVETLKREFGADRVSIMDFGVIRKGQATFLTEFIRRHISKSMDLDLDYDAVNNPSISSRGLEIALRINPLLEPNERGIVRRFLQKNFSNQTEPRPALLNDEQRAKLVQMYQTEYASLIESSSISWT